METLFCFHCLFVIVLCFISGTQTQRWLRQPTDQNVNIGDNVTFNCEAQGVDNLTHIWTQGVNPIFLNGAPAPNTPQRYRIEGENNLVIVGVTLQDDNFYSCTIFSFDAVQVKLTVQIPPGPPNIILHSSAPQLVEFSTVSLTCSSTGGKPAPTFLWLRNGQYVLGAVHTPPPTGDPKGTSSSHVTVTLSRDDNMANYSCAVFNAANQQTPWVASRILNVQYSPSIHITPAATPYNIQQGTNVKLTCYVDANPTYNFIEWGKDGLLVEGKLATLTLNSVQPSASGNYTCIASNSISGRTHTASASNLVQITATDQVASTNCEDGWTAYHGSCYLFAHNETFNFPGSENYCRRHNAHLVNIGDAAENNFIKSFLAALKAERFWIGVSDDVIENEWKWVDTYQIQAFSDWQSGEPNNSGGIEDCATMDPPSYKWNDAPCTQNHEPICERRVWDGPVPVVG